jgi:hypothetical protein
MVWFFVILWGKLLEACCVPSVVQKGVQLPDGKQEVARDANRGDEPTADQSKDCRLGKGEICCRFPELQRAAQRWLRIVILHSSEAGVPIAVRDCLGEPVPQERVQLCEGIALRPDEPKRAEDASRLQAFQRRIADAQVATSLPATEKRDGDWCLTFVGRYDSGGFWDAFFLHAEK